MQQKKTKTAVTAFQFADNGISENSESKTL